MPNAHEIRPLEAFGREIVPVVTDFQLSEENNMRIVMDRNTCTTVLPACEECFATFLLHDCVPDRGCIMDVTDDGQEETTLVLRYGEHAAEVLVTDENRELLAYDGWTAYVDVIPDFFSKGEK